MRFFIENASDRYPSAPKVCPKAFAIKASDHPLARFLFSAKGYLALQFVNEVLEEDDVA